MLTALSPKRPRRPSRAQKRQKKLQAYRHRRQQPPPGPPVLPSKGVFNLSSKPISHAALQTLNLGHKFIPTPGVDTSKSYLAYSIARYTRNVTLRAYFGNTNSTAFDLKYHTSNSVWNPPSVHPAVASFLQDVTTALHACYDARPVIMHMYPVADNMTPDMRRALFELQHDPHITVKPSDKNMGLCVMDRSWYVTECLRLLISDACMY